MLPFICRKQAAASFAKAPVRTSASAAELPLTPRSRALRREQPNGFTVWDTTCPGCTEGAQVGGTTALNQTYGWGCESGDAYGSGTSFDGGGVGDNQPDTGVWKVYSAVGPNHAPTSGLACSETWTSCSSTGADGTEYDGNSGWFVVDSYSCKSGNCGGYGVTHSIAQTEGTTALRVSDFAVPDSSGRPGGDVDVGYPCANTWCQSVPDTSQHQLAAITVASVEEKQKANVVRPTPGHLMMTGCLHRSPLVQIPSS